MPPKRILAIDGGGVRGIVAIAFVERLEAQLQAEFGSGYALRDHFDLIGGTSTGALIATALSLGVSAAELREFYLKLAPLVFHRRLARIGLVQPLFLARELEAHIVSITGDRRLDSPDLRESGLAIITKRFDSGSVWFITNNPRAPYWNDGKHLGNRAYSLAKVVRASSAAPMYFAPEPLEIIPGTLTGTFIDGSVSPHNNPALALFQIATIPAYGYGWAAGADVLDITSIGTGSSRVPLRHGFLTRLAAGFAIESLESLISDSELQVLTLMQALGRSETAWFINRELGDMAGVCIAPEPLFTFRRYNILLEEKWLADELGETVTPAELEAYARIDQPKAMGRLHELAAKAAERQIPAGARPRRGATAQPTSS